jgi:hypothetical protein
MKKALKILAIYSILLLSYSILVNFLIIGREIAPNLKTALTTLVTMLPIIVFAILTLIYIKKVG